MSIITTHVVNYLSTCGMRVEGHFEFYGAVRAREKNPRQGEMVNAFVLSPAEEVKALEQIKLLRKQTDIPPPVISPATVPDPSGLAPWITSFETRLTEMRELVFQNQQGIDLRLKELEQKLPVDSKKDKTFLDFINNLSGESLTQALISYKLTQKQANALTLAKEKQPNQRFASYDEIIKCTSGLGHASLIKCIDLWESQQRTGTNRHQ